MSRARRPARKQAARINRSVLHLLYETAKSLVFALLVVTALHTFIVQPFTVPTPSMAGTIVPGDYVVVSKVHYGPKTPVSPGIPFLKLYVPGVTLPSVRLPGFSSIERGDVVVFHLPIEDVPVDQKTPYLKRVVALPGDVFEIRDKALFVNGERLPFPEKMQQLWWIHLKEGQAYLSESQLVQRGVSATYRTDNTELLLIEATNEAIQKVESLAAVERVEPYSFSSDASDDIFPKGSGFTPDEYGPITIPYRGQVVPLDETTLPTYGAIIEKYEGHTVERGDDHTFLIDGRPAQTYTIEQDYYFMMGDNRDNSLDSRFWGFVPEDHVMGKAVATVFSWDEETHRPRFDRMFRPIQ